MNGALKKVDEQAGYENDFYSWTLQQARLLRDGKLSDIDVANIAEELETLARSERSALRSYYEVLCVHLIKLAHQPRMQSKSRASSIVQARSKIVRIVKDNPGLKPHQDSLFVEAYEDAIRVASSETNIPTNMFSKVLLFSRADAESFTFTPR